MSVRVCAAEMERMRSLRSRSVKLRFPLRLVAARQARRPGTRVYAFSNVIPGKEIRGRACKRGRAPGRLGVSSLIDSPAGARACRVFCSGLLLRPLKRRISFRLKGELFFLVVSRFLVREIRSTMPSRETWVFRGPFASNRNPGKFIYARKTRKHRLEVMDDKGNVSPVSRELVVNYRARFSFE